jgi:Tol biopolymer transport system component
MRALDGSDFSLAGQPMNVWTINVDGSGLTALTKLANLTSPAAILINRAPVWSPDGKLIAFASDRALDGSDNSDLNGTFNIWVMNADGTNAKPLTNLTAMNAASVVPVWSPDGAKIAYSSQRALDGSDALGVGTNIWVMNADGTGNKHLTDEDLGAQSAGPAWSPDGTLIAFGSNRALNGTHNVSANNTSNVWVMNSNDGSGRTALSTYTAASIGPQGYAWSPDNVHLVYSLNGDLNLDKASVENVFSVNPHIASPFARTALTQLTHPHSLDPAFSPDGSKIIFMSNRALAGGDALEGSGVVNFWVMNADGSAPAPLTQFHVFGLNTQAFQGGEYQLSKDGSQIVFASLRALDGSEALDPGAQNIWVMNSDGSGQKPVTKTSSGNTDAFFPQWHP